MPILGRQEVHRRLLYRTGRLALTPLGTGADSREAIAYVLTCPGVEFLNFLEDIFNNDAFFQVNLGDTNIVDELNALLLQDNLPHSALRYAREKPKSLNASTAERFAEVRQPYDKYPERFDLWCGFDLSGNEQPGFAADAVKALEECHHEGAIGGDCADPAIREPVPSEIPGSRALRYQRRRLSGRRAVETRAAAR
jgi:hypothetical protein